MNYRYPVTAFLIFASVGCGSQKPESAPATTPAARVESPYRAKLRENDSSVLSFIQETQCLIPGVHSLGDQTACLEAVLRHDLISKLSVEELGTAKHLIESPSTARMLFPKNEAQAQQLARRFK